MPADDEPGAIAVFGSSEPRPGEPLYEQARELGSLLASSGYAVITGGYGGVMEGASRGAREAGGQVIGVTCAVFSGRAPNRFLTETITAPDLYVRTERLIERARGYVVLPGKSGTLAELAMLWALDRAGCLADRPVILLNEAWDPLFDQLSRSGMLEPSQLELTRRVAAPRDAVGVLRAALEG